MKKFEKKNYSEWKTKVLNKTEVIDVLKETLLNLNEKKYSFFNGINKNKNMEYIYLTEDDYIAYYTVPFTSKNKIEIDKLTEKIKIKNGLLYRWNKKNKKYEKTNIIKIEQCFLCKIPFFKRRLIDRLKKRLIFNLSIANIKNKNKIDFIKRKVYDE